jgi:hypothetical protein
MTMRVALLVSAILLCGAGARAQDPPEPLRDDPATQENESLRYFDPSDPDYKTPRAGEGFRTHIFGRYVEVEERDRRNTSAWDLGIVTTNPEADGASFAPFGALYFWRRYDDWFLRADAALVYNNVWGAHSLRQGSPWEVVLGFENQTVPTDSTLWADGEEIEHEKLRWGYVEGRAGLGWRRQIDPGFFDVRFVDEVHPQRPDNQLAIALLAEPKYLYFRQRNATPPFVVPQDTFQLDGRFQVRYDALRRNILDLPHRGIAAGFDATYGWRSNWEDWGIGRNEDANRARRPWTTSAYGMISTGVPGVATDRYRMAHSVYAGWGGNLDRFSSPRVGGGPTGHEFLSLARPIIPGAAMSEFTPDHYVIGMGEYTYELFFFTYLTARAAVGWLDRDRLRPSNSFNVRRENDFLTAVGARLTTGFFFHTRLLVDYNYNFDVIRDGDRGSNEVVVHISRSF